MINATALVTSHITIVPGTKVVLDMVGATGTVTAVAEGKFEVLWNRGGKRFWYENSFAYRLRAA